MSEFIAVDWGTSSFRASRIGAQGQVLKSVATSGGIGQIQAAQQHQYLLSHCAELMQKQENLSCVMSGMVGSTIGLQEVPYVDVGSPLPQLSQGLGRLKSSQINAWIVPGLVGHSRFGEMDVMRGEETQLLGWVTTANTQPNTQYWVCLPGTHSKWVHLQGDTVDHFSTVVSGELYALLSERSILVQGEQAFCEQAFMAGVERVAGGESLSHLLFSSRSRVLAKTMRLEHGAAYLSGLVIGAEIAAQLVAIKQQPVVLIGEPQLLALYQTALQFHGLTSSCYNGAEQVVKGLHYCFQHGLGG